MTMSVERGANCAVRPTVRNDPTVSCFAFRLVPRVQETGPKKDSSEKDACIKMLQ